MNMGGTPKSRGDMYSRSTSTPEDTITVCLDRIVSPSVKCRDIHTHDRILDLKRFDVVVEQEWPISGVNCEVLNESEYASYSL